MAKRLADQSTRSVATCATACRARMQAKPPCKPNPHASQGPMQARMQAPTKPSPHASPHATAAPRSYLRSRVVYTPHVDHHVRRGEHLRVAGADYVGVAERGRLAQLRCRGGGAVVVVVWWCGFGEQASTSARLLMEEPKQRHANAPCSSRAPHRSGRFRCVFR